MIDVAIAPLMWRLEHYNIDLGKAAAPILKYLSAFSAVRRSLIR